MWSPFLFISYSFRVMTS